MAAKAGIIYETMRPSHKLCKSPYPDLKLGDAPKKPLGKYGKMRLKYLEDYKQATLGKMLLKGNLWSHLSEIDELAQNQVDGIVEAMARQDSTNETLKAKDFMKWVGLMNNYLHCAEEIVLHDLIFC